MLKEYRKQIDLLDKELLKILQERFTITNKIWLYKKEKNIPILQENRYKSLLEEKIRLWKEYNLDESFIKELFDVIHKYSVKNQEKL